MDEDKHYVGYTLKVMMTIKENNGSSWIYLNKEMT